MTEDYSTTTLSHQRLGILGGGQLGKMLALAAGNWHYPVWIMDESSDFPAAPFATTFVEGSFSNFDDVLRFGRQVDVITVEIEHVNTAALLQLEAEGKTVHPSPSKLEIIKDKGRQKLFYQAHRLPTAPFQLFENEAEVHQALENGLIHFPFVQKLRTAGYDGRGVVLIESEAGLDKLMAGPCLVEEKIEFAKEISVLVARNGSGQTACFPSVEMDFNADANLLEWQICPAEIPKEIAIKAEALAVDTIQSYGVSGLLAVEMFLQPDGQLLINEVAPRPHNSGHHTIESCYTSQFEQHLRAVLDFPLGSTQLLCPSVMVNLLGEPGYKGAVIYKGWNECLEIPGVNIHLYGKTDTKPFRKMGHITVLGNTLEQAKERAYQAKQTLKVIGEQVM